MKPRGITIAVLSLCLLASCGGGAKSELADTFLLYDDAFIEMNSDLANCMADAVLQFEPITEEQVDAAIQTQDFEDALDELGDDLDDEQNDEIEANLTRCVNEYR